MVSVSKLMEANARKAKGVLLLHLKYLDEAKEELGRACMLYRQAASAARKRSGAAAVVLRTASHALAGRIRRKILTLQEEERGAQNGEAAALASLGYLHNTVGNLNGAQNCFRRALKMYVFTSSINTRVPRVM